MIVSEEELLKSNKYINQSPQYLREYEKFFRLLTMFSNYIMKSSEVFEEIINQTNVYDASGDMLEKLANRVGVSITDKSDPEYVDKLRIAIIGAGIKRTSKSSRYLLQEQLSNLFPSINSYTITDGGCCDDAVKMEMKMQVIGNISALDAKILEEFVIPKMTGVNLNITYILYGVDLFAFDKDITLKDNPDRDYGETGWDKGEWAKISSK